MERHQDLQQGLHHVSSHRPILSQLETGKPPGMIASAPTPSLLSDTLISSPISLTVNPTLNS